MDKKKGIVIAVVVLLLLMVGTFAFQRNDEELFEAPSQNQQGDKDDGSNSSESGTDNESTEEETTLPAGNGNQQNGQQTGNTQNPEDKVTVSVEKLKVSVGSGNEVLTQINTTDTELQKLLDELRGVIGEGEQLINNPTVQAEVDQKQQEIDSMIEKINQYLTNAYQKAEEAVKRSEEENTKENIEAAKEIVSRLPDGDKKNELWDRIKDTTFPVITKVEDDSYVNHSVSPKVYDDYLDTVVLTKDGVVVENYQDNMYELSHDGKYVLTATDESGNQTTVEFTIDKTKPVITGAEDGKHYNTDVTLNADEVNPGTIHLKKDGKLVKNYEFGTPLTEEGSYEVYMSDKAGNKSDTIRFVIDKTAPVITVVEPNRYQIEVGSDYVDKGYSAFDEIDKDLTANVTMTYRFQAQGSNNWTDPEQMDTNLLGTYKITYHVVDKAGNEATATRVVQIVDTTLPTFHPSYWRKTVEADQTKEFTEFPEVKVSDNAEGEVTWKLVNNTVNMAVPGEYKLQYVTTDASGNKAYNDVFITVVDTTKPIFQPSYWRKTVEADQTKEFTEFPEIKVSDNAAGEVTWELVNNTVNMAVPGEYKLQYVITDAAGNKAYNDIFITVVDTTAPVFRGMGIFNWTNANNGEDPKYATANEHIRLFVTFDEMLAVNPKVDIYGQDDTVTTLELKYSEAAKFYYVEFDTTEELNLPQGKINYKIYGYADASGNPGVELTQDNTTDKRYLEVIYDSIAPVLNFNNGFITSGHTIEATDDNFSYMTIEYFDGREMKKVDTNTFELNENGDNVRYNIKAYDVAGNVSAYSDLYLDNQKPVISGSAIQGSNEVVLTSGEFYQQVTLHIEDGSMKKVVLVNTDGTEEVLKEFENNYTSKKVVYEEVFEKDGTYTIKAIDRNNNVSEITFTIDTEKAKAAAVNLLVDGDPNEKIDYYATNGDTLYAYVRLNEELKENPKFYFVNNGVEYEASDVTKVGPNDNGEYEYRVRYTISEEIPMVDGLIELKITNINDKAGNVTENITKLTNPHVIHLDRTAPNALAFRMYGGNYQTVDDKTIWYVTNGSKLYIYAEFAEKLAVSPKALINDAVEVSFNDGTLRDDRYIYSAIYVLNENDHLKDGEMNIRVTGYADEAGNVGPELTNSNITLPGQKYVVIDKTAPVISETEITNNERLYVTDKNAFSLTLSQGDKLIRSENSSNAQGTHTVSFLYNYLTDGTYEVVVKDLAGNTVTKTINLFRLNITEQKVGANPINPNGSFGIFNSFAIRLNKDLTFKRFDSNYNFKISMEYSTDGVIYNPTDTTLQNFGFETDISKNPNEKYTGMTFTVKAGEAILWNATSVNTRWSEIYDAILATKDNDNKVYVRTVFTVVQPGYEKTFKLNEVTYSKGGSEVTPLGLAQF